MEEDKSREIIDSYQLPERTNFDPSLSPRNIHNVEAAEVRGLRYDSRKNGYVDEDGCLIRDRFGQPY